MVLLSLSFQGFNHYGILGMRERVDALAGTLTIEPHANTGVVLRVRIPR